jgi:hypothetical protein
MTFGIDAKCEGSPWGMRRQQADPCQTGYGKIHVTATARKG